jgi:hypothetical protein
MVFHLLPLHEYRFPGGSGIAWAFIAELRVTASEFYCAYLLGESGFFYCFLEIQKNPGVKGPYVLTPAPLYFVKRGINLFHEHSNPNEV